MPHQVTEPRSSSVPVLAEPPSTEFFRYGSTVGIEEDPPSENEYTATSQVEQFDAESVIGLKLNRAKSYFGSTRARTAQQTEVLSDTGGFDIYLDDREGQAQEQEPHGDEVFSSQGLSPQDDSTIRKVSSAPEDTGGAAYSNAFFPLPSPWHPGPKQFQRTDNVRQTLRDSVGSGHRRSRSGELVDGLRKYLPLNLSLPKFMSPHVSLPFLNNFSNGHSDDNVATREKGGRANVAPGGLPMSDSSSELSSEKTDEPQHRRPPALSRKTTLNRSSSDTSLYLKYTLSKAPSLGDDSRFEHVQNQVNSRFKAVIDSFKDSNIKLPAPAMLNFKPRSGGFDLGFLRNGSVSSDHLASMISKGAGRQINAREAPALKGKPHRAQVLPALRPDASATTAGMANTSAIAHPYFQQALQELEGDVVVMGGYRGSILRSAAPPHRRLWVPIKVGLNIRKVNLEVGLSPEDEENMEESIFPDGMLTHIGPVDISRRLFRRLRSSENARSGKLRVWDYGYDWRLSPHRLSAKLIRFLETLPCNQPEVSAARRGATVIAHSLGGLITRHAVNQRPELFAHVVYAGTPDTCVNILGPLRNGDEVLMSSRVLTAQVNFTFRTSFALLPLDNKCFFNKDTKEEYPVDFWDVNTWIDLRLSPCLGQPLPPFGHGASPGMVGTVLSSMASVMPHLSLPTRKSSPSRRSDSPAPHSNGHSSNTAAQEAANAVDNAASKAANAVGHSGGTTMAPQMGHNEAPQNSGHDPAKDVATASTLPFDAAVAYLFRTLRDVKRFKQESLACADLLAANAYPPAAAIYGKSVPTVYGAKVTSRDAIRHADAYDELAFASGDGVVLARAAVLPEGYVAASGGLVSSDRGHVTLLGDLEAVGRALVAVLRARRRGVGMGSARGEGVELGKDGGRGRVMSMVEYERSDWGILSLGDGVDGVTGVPCA